MNTDCKYLDLIHEASPISFAQQSPNKCLGLEILELIHVLTCNSPAIEIVIPWLVTGVEQQWKRPVLGVSQPCLCKLSRIQRDNLDHTVVTK